LWFVDPVGFTSKSRGLMLQVFVECQQRIEAAVK
jgi:hypothetical protein